MEKRKLSEIAADMRKTIDEDVIVQAIKDREIIEIEEHYTEQQYYPHGVYVFCSDEEIGGIMFGRRD